MNPALTFLALTTGGNPEPVTWVPVAPVTWQAVSKCECGPACKCDPCVCAPTATKTVTEWHETAGARQTVCANGRCSLVETAGAADSTSVVQYAPVTSAPVQTAVYSTAEPRLGFFRNRASGDREPVLRIRGGPGLFRSLFGGRRGGCGQ